MPRVPSFGLVVFLVFMMSQSSGFVHAEALEAKSCCGSSNSDEWLLFRMMGEEVLDSISIDVPRDSGVLSRVPHLGSTGKMIDIIIFKEGKGADPEKVPIRKPGEKCFFAWVEGAGMLNVNQIDEGERWLFKLGTVFVERRIPSSLDQFVVQYKYKTKERTITEGEQLLTKMGITHVNCKRNTDNSTVKRLLYLGPCDDWSQLAEDVASLDWLKSDLPEEYGSLYFGPVESGADLEIIVDNSTYVTTTP